MEFQEITEFSPAFDRRDPDGSTLNAEPVFEILLKEGSAGVWRELREYYDRTFPDRRLTSDGNL